MRRASIITVFFISIFSCTNYSTADAILVNIPIITAITRNATGSGHLIEMSAQNAEIGFAGYRLFAGATEQDVLSAPPSAGTDCSLPLYLIPNQGIPYKIEVDPAAVPPVNNSLNIVCSVPVTLTVGNYTAVRPLIYSDLSTITTGLSSNAVIVP